MIEVTATGSVSGDTAAMQDALSQGGHILVDEYLKPSTPLRFVERTRLTVGPHGVVERAGAPGLLRNRWEGDNYYGYAGRGDIVVDGSGVLDMAGHCAGDTALPASAITLAHAENITVRGVTIRNVPGAHGIDLIGCRNVRIKNVTFEGFTDTGGRHFSEAIQIDGAYGAYSGDALPADKTPCDDVLVSGCRFAASDVLPAWARAVGSHGIADDVTGHEHRGIRVVDCAMDGCTDSAVYAWKWSRSLIARNIITGPALNGVVLKDGTWDVDVEHNQIYDAGYSGIWANGGCHNFALHRNRIIGASAAAHNTHYGIRVSGGCATAEITDNRVRRRGSGNEARHGLSIASGQVRMTHHGNSLVWSGISGALDDDSTSPSTSGEDTV